MAQNHGSSVVTGIENGSVMLAMISPADRLKLCGYESDAFSHIVRQLLGSRSGKWRWVKRKFNRRARKAARLSLRFK